MNLLSLLAAAPLVASALAESTTIILPTITPSTSTSTSNILTHTGPFDATTRQNPTLNFYEKYVAKISALDLAGQFPDFYAPAAVFYNTNSSVYVGGATIAGWIERLFAPFDHIEVNHHVMRVLPYEATRAAGDEGPDDWGNVDARCQAVGTCMRIMTEHEFVFFLQPPLEGPGIPVRRAMSWVLGPAQIPGQGTDGKQWYSSKVWWDEKVLFDEIARREAAAGSS